MLLKFMRQRKKLKDLLKGVDKINLTTDLWSSKPQKIENMVLTAHFVDKNWKLQKQVWSFVHLPPPRKGKDIANCIFKCLKEWDIKNKSSMWKVRSEEATNIRKSKFDSYLKELHVFVDEDSQFDVLEWWKDKSYEFPILSRTRALVPITTVASEATFSAGSRVIDP
ncbi:putative AC9 transposase [Bienertia sinuspersici]